MKNNQDTRNDKEILNRFDVIFNSVPELQSDEEIDMYLNENDFDIQALKEKGNDFAEKLMNENWRFMSDENTDQETSIENIAPTRLSMGREWLIQAIQRNAPKNFQFANRNIKDLTPKDLASLLQEIEFYLIQNGKVLE